MEEMCRIGSISFGPGCPKLKTQVGVTYDISTPEEELKKARAAVKAGTDIIADASIGKNCVETLKLLCANLEVPITSLPGYALATQDGDNELSDTISKSQILEAIEEQFTYGVKGITIHAPLRKKHIPLLENSSRVFPFTSRMGNYILKYMKRTGKENPFYECFPEIVSLCKKYDALLSLGVSTRSPSITNDGGFDDLLITETKDSAELVKLCRDNGVPANLESGGHLSLDKIEKWYSFSKEHCQNVPLSTLTVMTDRGMGHDNVTGAISAAFLARLGVGLICTITNAEHIGQPTLEDIVESVIHFRIALNIVNPDMELEEKVARARVEGGCHLPNVIKHVIDPAGAYKGFVSRAGLDLVEMESAAAQLAECTMCGTSCPLKKVKSNSGGGI